MQGDNHTDVVSVIKRGLMVSAVNLAGACGAFEITKRVAWHLRDEGIGLLSKPFGENCNGFAAGYLVYRDGVGVDILGDAGGASIPQWSMDAADVSLIDRWAAPFDPGDVPAPEPAPTPAPDPLDAPATKRDLQLAVRLILDMGAADREAIQQQIDQVVKNAEASGKAIRAVVEPLLPALSGLFGSK